MNNGLQLHLNVNFFFLFGAGSFYPLSVSEKTAYAPPSSSSLGGRGLKISEVFPEGGGVRNFYFGGGGRVILLGG